MPAKAACSSTRFQSSRICFHFVSDGSGGMINIVLVRYSFPVQENVGPHMLSRVVVVTTIGSFSAIAAFARPTTLCLSSAIE